MFTTDVMPILMYRQIKRIGTLFLEYAKHGQMKMGEREVIGIQF